MSHQKKCDGFRIIGICFSYKNAGFGIIIIFLIVALLILAISTYKQFRIIGYYPAWGTYQRNFQVKDIDVSKLTHINYAFGNVVNNRCLVGVTQLGVGDAYADYGKVFTREESIDGVADIWNQPLVGNWNQLKKLKNRNAHVKILISLGGWNWSGGFSSAAQSEHRTQFVSSCIDAYIHGNLPVIDNHGGRGVAAGIFDGIDIDWEYPTTPEDKANYTELLREFRRQLDQVNPNLLLTVALPAGPQQIANIQIDSISSIVTFANLMTYDFHVYSPQDQIANHNAPLSSNTSDPSLEAENLTVDAAVQAYADNGMPRHKINIGLSFYGRGWTGCSDTNHGLFQQCTGAIPGTWGDIGVLDFSDIENNYNQSTGYTRYMDTDAHVPYLYNSTTHTFISFDDSESLRTKIDYLKFTEGLGGAMIWELSADRNGTLLQTVSDNLRH